jgi:hypothetical protein
VVRELPDETLVFDLRTNKAHCLNQAAALVWRLCDGRTDPAALAAALRDELGVPDGEAAARLALEQLSRRGLLERPVEAAAPAERIGRREALRKLAVLGALPLVMTVAARHASAATSLCLTGDPCRPLGLMINRVCVPTAPAPQGTPCGSTAGMVCDGNGNCVNAQAPSNPPAGGGNTNTNCNGVNCVTFAQKNCSPGVSAVCVNGQCQCTAP